MNVDASITLKRPIDEVFAYVTDVPKMAHWVTGVSSAELISDAMGNGARFVCRYTSAFRPNELELVVTSYAPPAVFGIQIARGPFNFDGTISLEADGDGTRIVTTTAVDPDSLATRLASLLFGWFVAPSMRKRLTRELEALRDAMMRERLADA